MFENMKKNLKYKKLRKEWLNINQHNFTDLGKICDINKIQVGMKTYGVLNVSTFGNKEEFLKIGHFCSIGENVSFILGGGHYGKSFSTYPFKKKLLNQDEAITKGPIIVEDDVWIGNGTIILSGVTIGKGAIIAAGSVVTKSVEPYSLHAGNPARHIKYRIDSPQIREFLYKNLDFSKLYLPKVEENIESFYTELTEENFRVKFNQIFN